MKERPILFSAPMVRALLAGTKSQTRRVVRPQPMDPYTDRELPAGADPGHLLPRCPYGAPGDQLWVRETWAWDGAKSRCAEYRATWECKRDAPGVRCEHGPARWRPSVYMPRWASRITLEVTGIRVERLQAITQADARAEGCDLGTAGAWEALGPPLPDTDRAGPRGAYESLWDNINGAGSWNANPWVWVITFRRLP